MAAYGFQGLESLTGPGMQFHFLASLEQGISFGLELRPFKCEGWRTMVYICRANDFSLRGPRDTRGGYFRGSPHAGFSQGEKQRGKIDLYPLFSGRGREKRDNTALPRKFHQLRRLQRFLLKGRDFASAVL